MRARHRRAIARSRPVVLRAIVRRKVAVRSRVVRARLRQALPTLPQSRASRFRRASFARLLHLMMTTVVAVA